MSIQTRLATPEDAAEMAEVFYETIHTINIRDYTQAQVDVWAPDRPSASDWVQRQQGMTVYVAVEDDQHRLVGFAELKSDGYIDCFYCHKDFQGQGAGTQLMAELVAEAQARGLTKLTADVSITARPFFERRGFQVVRVQEEECQDIVLRFYVMEKPVPAVSHSSCP